ncbi:DAGAT domain-containing protein [Cinnamomum micranthum f. kanehirae]|uniref:Acyltransferase n=1 Tax=Cinnamomum micranthum f. kanehirae TaxID=337451 RepID=A0A443N5Q6_9MAGN|nr:DAGAT domain-containing protein [Cinnamomum micranthum f. kanehirae]
MSMEEIDREGEMLLRMRRSSSIKDKTETEIAVMMGRATDEEGWALLFHGLVAVWLLLGTIHLNLAVPFLSFALFSFPVAVLIFAFQLSLIVIPLDYTSKCGHAVARYISKYTCAYFPITLHVEDMKAFDPSKAYVFGAEPHSVFPIGIIALTNFAGFMPLPRIKILASTAVFNTPLLRQIWTWLGLVPATKKNFSSYLEAGYSCVIVPGGAREIVHMEEGSEVAFLKIRKGFVRMAMETGCPLVPVFCFGQSNVYRWLKPRRNGKVYSEISKALKCTPILFWGLYGTPIPYRRPMHLVVGRPIEVKRTPQPTSEEITEVHGKFVAALQELFENHKARVGYADLQLRIL